jgi:hypothetical protein
MRKANRYKIPPAAIILRIRLRERVCLASGHRSPALNLPPPVDKKINIKIKRTRGEQEADVLP